MILRCTDFSKGLLFQNSVFRVVNPILDKLIINSDFRGIELWAWMITRKFNWIKNSNYFDSEYSNTGKKLIRKLDLFNPEVVEKIISVYKELALKKISGILIQDDLTIGLKEGFSNWGKAKFSMITDLPAEEAKMVEKNSRHNSEWIRIKTNQVNRVLGSIIKNCKQVNPAIRIGMNLHYETPFFIKNSESWYSHNLREILNTGIDYIYLMSYHRQIKKELKLKERKNRELFKKIIKNASHLCKDKLIVKLQIRDWETGQRIPSSEIIDYIRIIPDEVNKICFTPVRVRDIEYLKRIIATVER